MSRVLVVTAAALALAAGLVGLSPRAPTPGHCGCVNKDSCVEPCSACCGPNGYADCFKNPSPSRAAPCCAPRRRP